MTRSFPCGQPDEAAFGSGIAASAVSELAAFGVVAEPVGDLGLAAATDEVILHEAKQRGAVVVTLDADFTRF